MSKSPGNEACTVDAVTLEIISARLHQITKDMAITLERLGATVNTTQMKDYISTLYDRRGQLLSSGEQANFHIFCAGRAVDKIIASYGEDQIRPGDMFLLNDPYVAAIHQSDVYIIAPIHFANELVAWSATFVHVMDIGALSPGGNSPAATHICHEGVRVPAIRIIEQGALREDVFWSLVNMTRQPRMVALDLRCEIAANHVGRQRVVELYERYGSELLQRVYHAMMAESETVIRRRLQDLPRGRWTAGVTIDAGGRSWRVELALTNRGDSLLFDFDGTDEQAYVGINLPYQATHGSCGEAVLTTLAYDQPKTEGAIRPIEVLAPEATLVNCQWPAPVSLNTTSGGAAARFLSKAVVAQMLGGTSRWRSEAIAEDMGGRVARHAGRNQHGDSYVSTLLPLRGGGARSYRDGVDCGGPMTSHNVEWVERNFPLLHLFRRYRVDGPGAGTFRGGAGEEMAWMLHRAPEEGITCVAYGSVGDTNSGHGLFGGYPGAPSELVVYEHSPVVHSIRAATWKGDGGDLGDRHRTLGYEEFSWGNDDVLYLSSVSGGGFGDPLRRDEGLVLADHVAGLVTAESARELYGVVILDGAVDAQATLAERERLRAERLRKAGLDSRALAGREPGVPPDDGQAGPALDQGLLYRESGGTWEATCRNCARPLAPALEDWTSAAARSVSAVTTAGAALAALSSRCRFEQVLCRNCGALLQSSIVAGVGEGGC